MSEHIEQFWRQATADDVARVMKGETVEARFRDEEHESWGIALLFGWSMDEGRDWTDSDYNGWRQCQVYDPPEWFVNKPDPGEGYRLLEKFPPEELRPEDEYFNSFIGEWMHSVNGEYGMSQEINIWYRRRIANNPEIPDSCRSRDTIPSGWRLLGKDEERLASDAYWSQGCKEWLLIGDDRVEYANDKTGKWHAIRQVVSTLRIGYAYQFPDGKFMKITAKGFEVV